MHCFLRISHRYVVLGSIFSGGLLIEELLVRTAFRPIRIHSLVQLCCVMTMSKPLICD